MTSANHSGVDTIVDVHVHLPLRGDQPLGEVAERVLRTMDRNGITSAVISPGPGYETPRGVADSSHQNDAVAEAVRRWPDRFIAGLAVVEPRHGASAVPEVTRALGDLGLRGLMFDSDVNGQPIDSDAVFRFLEAASDHENVVVQFHTAPYSVLRSTFRLGRVADAFPQMSFINGTALTDTTHEAATLDVARRCPNVYIDLAFARSHLYTVENVVAALDPSRILFGSGIPNTETVLQIELVRMAQVTENVKQQILGQSALGLFGTETS